MQLDGVKQINVKLTAAFRNFANAPKNCTFCPHCIYVCCIYLKTNGDFCPMEHKLAGFYNRDDGSLLSGWAVKCNVLRFLFKELIWVITDFDFDVDVECKYEMDPAFPMLSVNKPWPWRFNFTKISLCLYCYCHTCSAVVTSSLSVMLLLSYMAQLSGIQGFVAMYLRLVLLCYVVWWDYFSWGCCVKTSTFQIPLPYCGLEGALDTIHKEADDIILIFTYNLLREEWCASVSPLSGLLWHYLFNLLTPEVYI
jgi:hypothetical protein